MVGSDVKKDFNYYCNLHNTDRGDIAPNGHRYAHLYEKWFGPIKHNVFNICEIGVGGGGSLKAFADYFPNAHILGLDIQKKVDLETDRIKTWVLDQGSLPRLEEFVTECKKQQTQFDIMIDDGSHDIEHQQKTFGKFFELVRAGGLYILEDLCTSYFTLGVRLYGHIQTQTKINNTTIQFLNQRPFSSPWISEVDARHINDNVEYVSTFDRLNTTLTFNFPCVNNYPVRSITAVIKKK